MEIVTQAPLVPGVSDERYVERPEYARVLEAVRLGANVLLVGPRGAGATTLLRFCADQLRHDGRPVAFVTAGGADTTAIELLQLACLELSYLADGPTRDQLTAALSKPLISADPSVRAFELIRTLEGAMPQQHRVHDQPVFILDGVTANAGQELFGRLRDQLWRLPVRWVVSARERDRAAITAPPADAFFDAVIVLEPLPMNIRIALLHHAGVSPETASLLAQQAAQPRGLVQLLYYRTASGGDCELERLLTERQARMREAEKLGPSAARMLAELEDGPRSASDPDLLASLGFSRSRAAQVLTKLRSAGLVTAETTEDGRRVYQVRTG